MQIQAWQTTEHGVAPQRPDRAEAPVAALQRGVGLELRADAPQQRFGLEPRALAGGAGGVTAVLGQQHAHMHLVSAALQPVEIAPHAVELLLPVAAPIGVALDDPDALAFAEVGPRHIEPDLGLRGVALQIGLAFGKALRLPGFHRPGPQGFTHIGNHQIEIDADHPAEAATGFASADRRIEAEQAGTGVAVMDVAIRAVQIRGITPDGSFTLGGLGIARQLVHFHASLAQPQRHLDGLTEPRGLVGRQTQPVLHHVEHPSFGRVALAENAGVTLRGELLGDVLHAHALRHCHREHHGGAQPLRQQARAALHVLDDALRRIPPHLRAAAAAVQSGRAGEQQLEMISQLGHGAHGGTRGAHRVGLIDGDRRRNALDAIDLRAIHAVEKLPRVRRESLDIAPLAFGVHRVEHQRALARPRNAGDDDNAPQRNVQIEVLEIVLPRTDDADGALPI